MPLIASIASTLFALSSPIFMPIPGSDPISISVEDWGQFEGKPVHLWTLNNGKGMKMKVTDYGTIITELWVPDAKGKPIDVVLGRPSLAAYLERTQYFGCTAGRCANRIAKGKFTIDGKEFQVPCNNGANALHGGTRGFDKRLWSGSVNTVDGNPSITFTYQSPSGEEGFPGNCTARVTYTLTSKNQLHISMDATTDAATVVNLAHHSYWNLSGHSAGSVLDHTLQIEADRYTPVDSSLITSGEIKPVEGTPLDFRTAKAISQDMSRLPASKDDPGGFDHNWVLNGAPGSLHGAATLHSPQSGITLIIQTNQPGLQFYSGNFLDGIPGKNGALYGKNSGLCLETQAFPDSVNKQGKPLWPSVILRPGEAYHHTMIHSFTNQ